tara:strand:+ start:10155 stop:10610 length:456 start_codon:yes stop_codon:yes gene_type:complete
MSVEILKEGTIKTLDQAVAELINKAVSGVDTASEFLVEQTPDVLQQLMLWYGVSSAVKGVIGVVGFLIFTNVVITVYRALQSQNPSCKFFERYEDGTIEDLNAKSVSCMALGLVGLITGFCLIENFMEFLKIVIAPKIWLIEYAADLAKKF